MMDFWHCHKPDVESNGSSGHASEDQVDEGHVHETSAGSKGYRANTKFLATPGVGFVDITTFLLSDSDCTGIAPTDISAVNQVRCTSFLVCSFISIRDTRSAGYQEGGQACFLRRDGLVTDTNTQDQYPVTILRKQQSNIHTLFF
jgi:hypothetical protein